MAYGLTISNAGYSGFVIQGLLQYTGTNAGNFIGVTSAPKGTLESSPQQHSYVGFNASGFVLDAGGLITVLIPPSQLGPGNNYVVTAWDMPNGTWTISAMPFAANSTWGGFGFIKSGNLIVNPSNFQVESTSSGDSMANLRVTSGGPASGPLLSPMFVGAQNTPTLIKLVDVANTPVWVLIPASYDATVPSRWVIYNHGYGGSGQGITNEGGLQNLTNALVQAGYVVVASDYNSSTCMGNGACVQDMEKMQTLLHQSFNLAGKPNVIGESMGGVVTWNAIDHGVLNPRSVVGIYPICSLNAIYTDSTNSILPPAIRDAYGITPTNSYSVATAGLDPLLAPMSNFTAFPILMWSSYGDTTVFRSTNEDPFVAAVNAAGGNAVIRTSVGVHGDFSNFDPDAVVSFFNAN